MSVLETSPPRFTAADAARIAADLYGVEGAAAELGSERDQTFLIDDGADGAILKISNTGEDAAVLDLEERAIAHVAAVDPGLPVARPLTPRTTYEGHHVRLFERRRGHKGDHTAGDATIRDLATVHARLNRALRSFFHPAAARDLLWDLASTPRLRPLIDAVGDDRRRRTVGDVLDRFEAQVVPRWPLLRAQVVHGDLNLDNVLLDDDGRVAGIVDFGDCGYSAQAGDFAIALASVMRGRPRHDVFRAARVAIDAYAALLPFEPLELELLARLVEARLAAIVVISAWRVRAYPENAAYIQAWDDDSWELLGLFEELGPNAVARELGAPSSRSPTPELGRRRARTMGILLTPLTYAEPVHVVRGDGVWLEDADGRRLLDAYNNVPVVGHCHPRVTEAVVDQTRRLNTHARYLYEPLVELAERLLATMPPAARLDTVMLVNSGSEANDLAWRIATSATGRTGAIVTEHAYHGVTAATSDLSPEEWPDGYAPPWVARIAPPASGADLEAELDRAFAALDGVAAVFLDGALTSDGVFTPSADELFALIERTHAAGALYVADEVQAGHGRTGLHLWSFAPHGVAPDIVTLGKPMGNGYPVAAVVTRRDLAERFPYAGRTFSTFGGNPVAARAALAVLDVIADEQLVPRSRSVGDRLRREIVSLRHPDVVAVRGSGLITGVQLASAALAGRVVDDLRRAGVLVGRTGKRGDVLKIRPPLVFDDGHADLLVAALNRCLTP
ncbi:MAG TPA: aminotransferase class III-fold pyridoxal phosphate-dependent enzyme [Gaiellaceae bacterium]|nr:aminotransferase class III-fold pyridoxal phosphate-dependent enzyme [Gaiellaceae bacterium]